MFKDLGIFISGNLKWNLHINYMYCSASILSFQILKSFRSTEFEILKKLYLVYIGPKIEYNTPLWSPCCIKDINQLESIQRKFTRIIFNRFNISYICYIDRLTKLNIKTLEYRIIEYDLITFFKLVNNDTTTNSQTFLKIITHSEVIIENIHAIITSTMLVGKIHFSIVL